MFSDGIVLSLRPGKLPLLEEINAGLELKLDREDADVVTGERSLESVFADYAFPPEGCVSIHPPPGNRGRETDTSIVRENIGTLIRFNDTQLQSLRPEFVTLHTIRRFDVRDQLFVLQEMAANMDVSLAVENPPGSSYWATPEDHAFFAYAATIADSTWSLTVDTYHLTDDPTTDFLVKDHITTVIDRAAADGVSEDALDRFQNRIRVRAADAPTLDFRSVCDDPWLPTLRTLVLAGDHVQSLHFNDPINDGIPDLVHTDSPVLEAIFDLVAQHDIYLVLEPDTYDIDVLRSVLATLRDRL